MLSTQDRKKLIGKISRATGIAQYALEKKMTDQQLIEAGNHLITLTLIKSANDYNRYCQGQKTAEAKAKLKEFLNLQNSEIYKAGQWLVSCLSTNGQERKKYLLEKELVHKDDYNEARRNLGDTIKEQLKIADSQVEEAVNKIQILENINDNLRSQMQSVKDYIIKKYGFDEWNNIIKYFPKSNK
jgi:hypothetical protein